MVPKIPLTNAESSSPPYFFASSTASLMDTLAGISPSYSISYTDTRITAIATREMLGSEIQYKINLTDGRTVMVKRPEDGGREGEHVWAMVRAEHVHFFDNDGLHMGHGGPEPLLRSLGGMLNAQ